MRSLLVALIVTLILAAAFAFNHFWGDGDTDARVGARADSASSPAAGQAARNALRAGSLNGLPSTFGVESVYEALAISEVSVPAPEGGEIIYLAERSIDGDSFYTSDGREVRMYGINTVERGLRCYMDAAFELREFLSGGFVLEPGPRAKDAYDRDLYYVFTPEGESADLHMVASGFARAFRSDGQHQAALARAEELARRFNVGCLWSE